jgi:hypothetical protein
METLKNFLWPIVAIGGLGAFIDFLIGKTGQAKTKDFLLRWWVRFDDVHWRNFGREEGLFAGQLIERWFGKRIWSFRRFVMSFSIFTVLLVIEYFKFLISPNEHDIFCLGCNSDNVKYGITGTGMILIYSDDKDIHNFVCGYCASKRLWSLGWTSLFTSIAAFCISVSFTKINYVPNGCTMRCGSIKKYNCVHVNVGT